ncbi:SPOR domain-containing protein [Paralimibaculum aggregatum]|nr:SPOR domain-containing protein [Limibaculum sp. NKW23]
MWIGAGLAVAVLGGLGYWLYDLGTRETAEIPVVAAAAGPIKSVPEAEGSKVRHRDIDSFDLAEADTGEDTGSDATTGFAPTPGPLTEEDISLRDLEDILGVPTPSSASASDALGFAPAPAPAPAVPLIAPDGTEAPAPRPGSAGAEIARRSDETESALRSRAVPIPEPAPSARAVPEPAPEPALEDTGAPAPTVSPMARPRPNNLPERVAAAQRQAIEDVASLRDEAARSPFQIQLGAYKSEDEVKSDWRRIASANTDLLNNRALAVQTTRSGGRTWYRLRVGPFASLTEAASICEALRARDQACIPAENR